MRSSKLASAPSNASPSASSSLISFDSSRGSTTPSSWCPSCSARIEMLAVRRAPRRRAGPRCRRPPGRCAGSSARPWPRRRRGRRPCARRPTGRHRAGSRSASTLAISAIERDSSVRPARSPPPAGTRRVRRLEREVGQDADHVGVAGAFAVAVDRGLDVAHPGGDGGHRVGDGQVRVVVGVDPPGHPRRVAIGLERWSGRRRRS